LANKVHVKKGETVVILSGKDKGKKGKVLNVYPDEQKILVEGVNMVTKHVKPRNQYQQGGLVHQESPIYAAKAMVMCDKCGKPTRIAKEINDDGTKFRVCKKCGEQLKV
jgi:large subunit ribosomal protein L24